MKINIIKKLVVIGMTGVLMLERMAGICAVTNHLEAYYLQEQEPSKTGYVSSQWVDSEGKVQKENVRRRTSSDVSMALQNGNLTLDETDITSQFLASTRFDLRDVNGESYVTPVKNQGETGSCWAFAAMSVLESNYLAQEAGLDKNTSESSADNIDLSEAHLVNFAQNMNVTEPGDPTAYDKGIQVDDPFQYGGNVYYSIAALARWNGVDIEASSPFYSQSVSSMTYDEAKRYVSEYGLTDAEYFTDESNREEMMKRCLEQNHSSLVAAFYTGNSSTPLSYYYTSDADKIADHEVAIIGWDDTIPAQSFQNMNGEVPKRDGGWLVKSSWGTKGSNQTGYCWVSYEDATLTDCCALYMLKCGEKFDNNYQYNGAYPQIQINAEKTANVFTAEEEETLTAVSFYTQENQVSYEIEIYSDDGDAALAGPEFGGNLVARESGNQLQEGYHTIYLQQLVNLQKGQRFSVVVKLLDSAQEAANQSFEGEDGFAKKGQSYYYDNGKWYDVKDEKAEWNTLNNCFIRAFTSDSDMVRKNKIARYKADLQALLEETKDLERGNAATSVWQLYQNSYQDAKSLCKQTATNYSSYKNAYLRLLAASNQVKKENQDDEDENILKISSEAEWLSFVEKVNEGEKYLGQKIVLTSNLDLTEYSLEEIMVGNASRKFSGDFDGNGHTITVHIEQASGSVGLFYEVNYGAISNLTVSGSISSSGTVGYTAAIASNIRGARIDNCVSNVAITAENIAAGVVGSATNDSCIVQCVNQNEIESTASYAGGVVGLLGRNATLTMSCNKGNIKADNYVGGLVAYSNATCEITNSYVQVCDLISGNDLVGDLVGRNDSEMLSIHSCYSLANTSNHCSYSGEQGDENVTAFYYIGVTKEAAKEAFADGTIAYLLNTENRTVPNTGIWSQNSYPVIATSNALRPVYRIVFQTEEEENIRYTEKDGVIAENIPVCLTGYHWEDEEENYCTQETVYHMDSLLTQVNDKQTENSPNTTVASPSTTENSPNSTVASPSTTENSPNSTVASPSTTENSPNTTVASPNTTENSPNSTVASPSTTENNPNSTVASASTTENNPNSTVANSSTTATSPSTTTQDTVPVNEVGMDSDGGDSEQLKKGEKLYTDKEGHLCASKKNACCEYTVTGTRKMAFTKLLVTKQKSIKIPSVVTDRYGNKYKVTSIKAKAFAGSKVQRINIGKNVKTIGKRAFYRCQSLKQITGCKGVTTIQTEAFFKCINLKKMAHLTAVKTIQKKAFYGCNVKLTQTSHIKYNTEQIVTIFNEKHALA